MDHPQLCKTRNATFIEAIHFNTGRLDLVDFDFDPDFDREDEDEAFLCEIKATAFYLSCGGVFFAGESDQAKPDSSVKHLRHWGH